MVNIIQFDDKFTRKINDLRKKRMNGKCFNKLNKISV